LQTVTLDPFDMAFTFWEIMSTELTEEIDLESKGAMKIYPPP
jgi:hypothetical protein